jgi:hypothetical protein
MKQINKVLTGGGREYPAPAKITVMKKEVKKPEKKRQ